MKKGSQDKKRKNKLTTDTRRIRHIPNAVHLKSNFELETAANGALVWQPTAVNIHVNNRWI